VDAYKLHNPFGRNRISTALMANLPQTAIIDSSQTFLIMNMIDEDFSVTPSVDYLKCCVFNMKTNSWMRQIPPKPFEYLGYPRDEIRVKQVEATVRSGRLLIGVVTGSIVNGYEALDFFLYDSSKNAWTQFEDEFVTHTMSFQFIHPGFILVALMENRGEGPFDRAPVLNLYHDTDINGPPLKSFHFPAWDIMTIEVRPNTSPQSEAEAPQDALFYQDPSTRILVFVVEFRRENIPVNCTKRMFWIFNEAYFLPTGPPEVIPYSTWSMDGIYGNGAHSVPYTQYNVIGRRLMVPDMNFESPERPRCRIVSLGFKTHRNKRVESDSRFTTSWGEPMLSFKASEHHLLTMHKNQAGNRDVMVWQLT